MTTFQLHSEYQPAGDQPEAIDALLKGLENGSREQVLLGVTGSGKTYTMAKVIEKMNRPALIMSHNKTLAGQLYQEFREFFPNNAVSYFVSYYDFYQPEAYIPSTDTYIEKETEINEEIDKLRLAATTNLLTRPDTIIVASVSCIYNIGSPREYGHFVLELKPGVAVTRESIVTRLVELQYERGDFGFHRGTFRVRGNTIDIYPAYDDIAVRIVLNPNGIESLSRHDPVTGNKLEVIPATVIYPAKHYMTDREKYRSVFSQIRDDLESQVASFKASSKLLEAHRIEQRVQFDLEMIQEVGYINGIENYSRYFDGRKRGDPPYTLFDYFDEATAGKNGGWLLFVDESHMTIPQVRGMYHGDRTRKQTLVDYGFRLPAALDNRPLMFDEFLRRLPQTVYVSATPDEWEIERAASAYHSEGGKRRPKLPGVVEQLVRPTGLIDPIVTVRPVSGQIDDLLGEVALRISKHERVLVTTLTKQMAEDLSKHFEEKGLKVRYLHSDVQTLDRSDILTDLRMGTYDVIIGVNLLREGLDLPEVSLVAILDADKEGFLRSRTSLIQTMGRAARHIAGEVILYADTITDSMKYAIGEVNRRRKIQSQFNSEHHITATSIVKPVRNRLVDREATAPEESAETFLSLTGKDIDAMTPLDRKKLIAKLTIEMRNASRDLNFELALRLRDLIRELE